jgi:hypothetical protein
VTCSRAAVLRLGVAGASRDLRPSTSGQLPSSGPIAYPPQGRSAPVVVAAPFPPRAAPRGEVFQRAHHHTHSSTAPYPPSHLLLQVELGLTPTRNVARTTSSPPTFEFVMFKADHDRHPLRGWSRRMKHTALGARRGCTDTRYGLTNTGLKFPSEARTPCTVRRGASHARCAGQISRIRQRGPARTIASLR